MKKVKPPEKKAGIWLDQENAYIIWFKGENETVSEKIKSDVESRIRTAGEGKVSARFGNAFIDDQEKKQRRQRNQRHHYFEEIIERAQNADYIYLFGPSKAKEELNNAIENKKVFKGKVVAIENADKISENQMQERVLDYFNGEEFKSFKKALRKQLVK
jgi:tRNA G10  N-methylase Trm11